MNLDAIASQQPAVNITKREYIAVHLAQGMLSSDPEDTTRPEEFPRVIARAAVRMADALIVELNRDNRGEPA
jgi:hypothetical protein